MATVLSNYSGMTRKTVQLQAHNVAGDQSDSRILIIYSKRLKKKKNKQRKKHKNI